MTAHKLADYLLLGRDLEVIFTTFDYPEGREFTIYNKQGIENPVHEVIEHDEPEDFIEIIVEER